MSQAQITALPERSFDHEDALSQGDNLPRALANAILLALPLWGLIGLLVWALA